MLHLLNFYFTLLLYLVLMYQSIIVRGGVGILRDDFTFLSHQEYVNVHHSVWSRPQFGAAFRTQLEYIKSIRNQMVLYEKIPFLYT